MAKNKKKKRKNTNLNKIAPEANTAPVGEADAEVFEEEDPIEAVKEFLNKHGWTIILLLVITFGGIYLWNQWQTSISNQHHNAWAQLHQASSSAQALELAEAYASDEKLSALAVKKAADFLHAEALLGAPDAIIDDQAKATLDQALTQYERFIGMTPALINERPNLMKLNAIIAMGKIKESMGDNKAAEAEYQKVIDIVNGWADGKETDVIAEAYALNGKKEAAEAAIRGLGFLKAETFLPNMPAAPAVQATQPSTQPATQPAAEIITLPATQPSN